MSRACCANILTRSNKSFLLSTPSSTNTQPAQRIRSPWLTWHSSRAPYNRTCVEVWSEEPALLLIFLQLLRWAPPDVPLQIAFEALAAVELPHGLYWAAWCRALENTWSQTVPFSTWHASTECIRLGRHNMKAYLGSLVRVRSQGSVGGMSCH